jgi:type IV pilus assembly protein PilQ
MRLVAFACVAAACGLAVLANAVPGEERPPILAAAQPPEGLSPANRLVDVSVAEPGGAEYDVVLRGDGGLGYQVFALTGPDRLVVDLPGVHAAAKSRVEVDRQGLIRVRVGQYRDEPEAMTRVVLDLSAPLGWNVVQEGETLRVHVGPGTAIGRSAEPAAPAAVETAAAPRPVLVETPESLPSWAVARPDPVPTSGTTRAAAPVPAVEAAPRAPEPAPVAPPAVDARPQPVPVAETMPAPALAAETAAIPVATPAPAPIVTPAPVVHAAPAPVEIPAPAVTAAPVAAPAPAWNAAEVQAALGSAPAPPPAPLPAVVNAVSTAPAETTVSGAVPLPSDDIKAMGEIRKEYTGQPISLELVDADVKQVFGVFHEMSGLNFVLDPGVSGTVTIVVDQVPWDQALDIILKNNGLSMQMEGNVVRVAPVTKLAQEAQQKRQLWENQELEAPPVTITRTLSYARAKDIEKVVRDAIISTKGRVVIDERTNTLVIRDVPARLASIEGLMAALDAETPQVMIEARIVEVSRDFQQTLGINWGFTADADPAYGTQTGLDFPNRANVKWDLNLPRNPKASSLGFSFGNVLDSFTLDITIDALEAEGYARRLSAPKVATLNNETAEIEQGLRYPIVTTTATEVDVQFIAASLLLRVTPQITAEGTIALDLDVENNSPDFVVQVAGIPSINTQRAATKILIKDGGTAVIGGIFSVNEGNDEVGVPWLRKLPVLGWLFKSRGITSKNRELLIFVTGKIIKAY